MKLHVVIEKDEARYYAAEVPALPGCLSQGENEEEILTNVKERWLVGDHGSEDGRGSHSDCRDHALMG